MKKLIFIFILFSSCKKIDYAPAPAPPQFISKGKIALFPNPTAGKVTLLINVEPNVKYNLSVQNLNNKVIKSLSLNSVNSVVKREEDFSSLENGIYDLILINIKGNETRIPLIIKK